VQGATALQQSCNRAATALRLAAYLCQQEQGSVQGAIKGGVGATEVEGRLLKAMTAPLPL